MSKLIKRYSNRKLYDTEQSTYVTLDEIKEMVQRGEDPQIIDNATKEDITHATLAQIVFEQEKSPRRTLSSSALRGIIQSGEEFIGRLQAPVTQFRDEFRRKAEALEEGGKAVRDFIESTQRSIEDMQRRFDDRLRDAFDQLTHIPELKRDIRQLEMKVSQLEHTVRRLEQEVRQHHPFQSGTSSDPFRDLPDRER